MVYPYTISLNQMDVWVSFGYPIVNFNTLMYLSLCVVKEQIGHPVVIFLASLDSLLQNYG